MNAPRPTRTCPVLEMGEPFTMFIHEEKGSGGGWDVSRCTIEYVTAREKLSGCEFDMEINLVGPVEWISINMCFEPAGWSPRLFLILLAKEIVENEGVLSFLNSDSSIDFNSMFNDVLLRDMDEVILEVNHSPYNNLVCGGFEYL